MAGKANLEGDLYMSKTLPYTIETLAIEFNRGEDQIKLALDVFIELEMLELTEGNVYSVKNFAKHQNIKVKEKIKSKDKDDEVKRKKVVLKEASKNVEAENKISRNDTAVLKIDERGNLESPSSSIKKVDNMSKENNNNNSQDNILMLLDTKKNKKANKNKKRSKSSDINDEEDALDNEIVYFYDSDEEKPLEEGESVVSKWFF